MTTSTPIAAPSSTHEVVVGIAPLSIADVVAVARHDARVTLHADALAAVAETRRHIEALADDAEPHYGISTGFGALATTFIQCEDREQLQLSLIRSHAAGSGAEVEREVVRALMLLRLSTLMTARTGVRATTAQAYADVLNAGITPIVREYGSLGCSGDLAPLAHCALAVIGEGEVRDAHGVARPASDALAAAGIQPVRLAEKEGLALINGTDGMLGMLALALTDLDVLYKTLDITASMSVEALLGTDAVFAADLQALRPQLGQADAAANMTAVLAGSPIVSSHAGPEDPTVQDAYSLRCSPQVAGAGRDTLAHARLVADRELASAVDNPVVTLDGRVVSNGNFHGAPVAYVLDFIAIAVADAASISERRIDRHLDTARNKGLPAFLADRAGVDSGLMIAQYTAAGIVSELKRLAAPASVDSIPSSAMQEDHVSMGWAAARKLRRAVDGLTRVLAIELLTASRALDLRAPLTPGDATAAAREVLRTKVDGPGPDRWLSAEIEDAVRLVADGSVLRAKSWQTEAPLRMLMNNLDPEVAERPEDLVVYGGTGRAARSWEAYDAIVRTLETLEPDETMLVQSGKPVGVFRTHEWAPRVLIANSNLVGDWATWPEFRRLESLGLTMYGQMTAGSWIYIGSQGILQGTYETFAAVANKIAARKGGNDQQSGGTLAGTLTLTGGAGGMGGAQPLAVTMNDGVVLIVDVDRSRLQRRVDHGYLDELTDDLDDAVARVLLAKDEKRALSVGLVGNAATVFPELLRRGVPIDIVTDQTSAHDPLSYLPEEYTVDQWHAAAQADPEGFTEKARRSMAKQVKAMVEFQDAGAEVFDYGNSIRAEAVLGGYDRAFEFPGFVPAHIRPLFEEGLGPFRWAALSGDPEDIAVTDQAILELFPENEKLRRWITKASEKVHFEGLPARICWLGYKERHLAGLKFNELVASGAISAPIVIGRDHLDSGSVASPYRETESMKDGSDAIADWPLLNALLNTASGATWVSIHHGGGVGIGRSIHAGQVVVADGTDLAAQKIERVLTNDPGTGVMRHVDAGYEHAADVARERGLRIPMLEG